MMVRLLLTSLLIIWMLLSKVKLEENEAEFSEVANRCAAENSVDPKFIPALKTGKFNTVNEKITCFALCYLQSYNIIDDNGVFMPEIAVTKFSTSQNRTLYQQKVNKCKDKTGKTACSIGYSILACIRVVPPKANPFTNKVSLF